MGEPHVGLPKAFGKFKQLTLCKINYCDKGRERSSNAFTFFSISYVYLSQNTGEKLRLWWGNFSPYDVASGEPCL